MAIIPFNLVGCQGITKHYGKISYQFCFYCQSLDKYFSDQYYVTCRLAKIARSGGKEIANSQKKAKKPDRVHLIPAEHEES